MKVFSMRQKIGCEYAQAGGIIQGVNPAAPKIYVDSLTAIEITNFSDLYKLYENMITVIIIIGSVKPHGKEVKFSVLFAQ